MNSDGNSLCHTGKGYLKPFINELRQYGPESRGFKVQDHSLSKRDPAYEFFFKILLLCILGDYPGISQLRCASDHKSCSGCIKCNQHPRYICRELNIVYYLTSFNFHLGQVTAVSSNRRLQFDLTTENARFEILYS